MPKKLKVFSKKKSKKKKSSSSSSDDDKPTPPPVESPQLDNQRNAITTVQRMSPIPPDRSRLESRQFPTGRASTVLSPRSRSTGPPGRVGSTHKFQLDVMDDITKLKSKKKVRLVTSKEDDVTTSPRAATYSEKYARYAERYNHRPAERTTQRPAERGTQTRRTQSAAPSFSFRDLIPEIPTTSMDAIPGTSGIARAAETVKKAMTNISFSPIETERSESSGSEYRRTWIEKLSKRKHKGKGSRSRSLDSSIIQGIKKKLSLVSPKKSTSAFTSPVRWLQRGHRKQNTHKRQTPQEFLKSALNIDIGSSHALKSMKKKLTKAKASEKKRKPKEKKTRSESKHRDTAGPSKYVLTFKSDTDSSDVDTDETEC